MKLIEKTLQMGGIPSREFIEYFIEIGCLWDGEKKFTAPNWEVRLHEKEELLGSMKIERVNITFKGEAELLEGIIATFRWKFMRAGG